MGDMGTQRLLMFAKPFFPAKMSSDNFKRRREQVKVSEVGVFVQER